MRAAGSERVSGHPADKDKPKEHPPQHVHDWVPIMNDWGEVAGYSCACGAYQSA
jgi:hypothetical protein